MHSRFLLPAALVALALPAALLARTYDTAHLTYRDSIADLSTRIAVSTLTEDGILDGYSDNTIRVGAPINRAEFLHVAMSARVWTQVMPQNLHCFLDVPEDAWFALDVCRAAEAGIVEGVTRPNTNVRFFEPARGVTYAEALKILTLLYGIDPDHVAATAWYDTYVLTAARLDLDLSGVSPMQQLTRGQSARLVAAFMAYGDGDLENYRRAERGESPVSSSRSSVSRSSSRSSVTSSASSRSSAPVSSRSSTSASSQSSQTTSAEAAVRSRLLLLGEVSGSIGAITVFSNNEPVDLRKVIITLSPAATTVDSFSVVWDGDIYLGRATRGSSETVYTLNVPSGTVTLPKRENESFAVQAITRSHDDGGVSGEEVTIDEIRVEGDGIWTNETYGQSTTETFQTSLTARGTISVTTAGLSDSVLVSGVQRQLGSFRFTGRRNDAQADVRVTDLVFQIESSGEVTLSNVRIRVEGEDASSSCTVGSSTVTCAAIPASVGDIDDGSRVLRLEGDVAITPGADDPFFRLTLNAPGTALSGGGDVTWTDGEAIFEWLPYESPLARGTLYR